MVSKTHYDVLEISSDAELIDVKKAYRRLALKHHPDRNNGSAESTERFKEISQAYTILSDATSRRDYDLSLRSPSTSVSASAADRPSHYRRTNVRDPFQQFNDLFRNDPFFHEAFKDMDDAFAQRFDNTNDLTRDDVSTANESEDAGVGPLFFCGVEKPRNQNAPKVSWGQWLMNKLGIELSVTSYSHQADGSVVHSAYTSKPSGTYTNKKSRICVENGQRVTVMSMEKDGNRIEDKLIGGKLVERRVNGKVEEITKQVAN